MKKLILVAIVALFAMSCEGPRGMDGRDGSDGSVNWRIVPLKVNSSDWKRSGAPDAPNSYYYYEFNNIRDLSQYIFDDGAVINYLVRRLDDGSYMKNPLPFVKHNSKIINGKEFLWTQTIDFDYSPGFVSIYVTNSDFSTTEEFRPPTMDFDLVLMW